MAEGEGFEPPLACAKAVFKTAAFDHSATPPTFQINWHGERESNPQPAVLETAALPIELSPSKKHGPGANQG